MKHIQKDIGLYETAGPLSSNYEVGSTIEDLEQGKFILLTQEQADFATANPRASIYEIFNKAIEPAQEVPVSFLRRLKVLEAIAYDASASVNSFLIGGMPMWLDRETRVSLTITIAAYKAYSLTDITLWTTGSNPIPITLPLGTLENLLRALEMYAKGCYDTTAQHKATIQTLQTKEEIESYDFTEGYPEKLSVII